MIAVIRISGRVGIKEEIENTLKRLNLNRKLSCTLIDEKDNVKIGMVKKIKDYVSYGKIDSELIKKLKEKRGGKGDKFFRLHPPIGGFRKSTKMGGKKGVLGEREDIDKLLVRML